MMNCTKSSWSLAALWTLAGFSSAHAGLLYGIDAKVDGATVIYNEFTSQGVDADTTTALGAAGSWITATASPAPANSLNVVANTGNGGTMNVVANPTGQYGITLVTKVDLTGTHDVTFDKFAIGFQRGGGTGGASIVGGAMYSTDGVNFSNVLVEEVAVGANDGSNNVGSAEAIANFRAPDGFGGTIGPQQVYVVSGLGGAGALDSGSFWIKLTVSAPSNNQANLTILNDRYDLSTSAMALQAANASDLGADDGYDIAWFGTATPVVPEPSTIALGGLVGLLALACQLRHRWG